MSELDLLALRKTSPHTGAVKVASKEGKQAVGSGSTPGTTGALGKQGKRLKVHLRAKDRIYFTANLALLFEAAVPVGDIFSSLQETSKSRSFIRALVQMRRDIEEGRPLWKALDRAGIVSDQTLALVELGEESGNLVKNLQIAAKQEEKQHMLRAKIGSALLYPGFVFAITFAVGLGVAWFLLPRLAETFSQLHIELPLVTRVVIGVGSFLGSNGAWFVPSLAVALALLAYVLFVARPTRNVGQRLLAHVPGISRLLHEVEIARFGYLLGTLLDAGLSITQSVQMLQESTASPQFRKFYGYLYDSFEDGYSLHASLQKYKAGNKLLPPAVQQMIFAGERSGNLSSVLLSVGTTYEEKSDITTQNLEAILEPILLIIVWLGVLIVAVAVILPIYSLVGGLNG
jgi:type IV pilus assembly protein PilC